MITEKQREYYRKWDQNHREKRRGYSKKYREKYREKKLETNRNWARNNRDKILGYLKKYQSSEKYKKYVHDTRHIRSARLRKKYAEDPEYRKKIKEYQKRWREKNKNYGKIMYEKKLAKEPKKIELEDDWLMEQS